MALTDLQGALVDLKLVREPGIAKLAARMQTPEVWDEAGCTQAPDQAWLTRRIVKEKLFFVWEMWPIAERKHVGYAGIVRYCGSPFFYVDFFAPPNLDYAVDALHALIHPLFEGTDEPDLLVHVPRPYDEELHATLVEAGFDPLTEVPGYDPKETKSYVLERATYEIYYGTGGDDGSDEALDDAEEEL